MSSAQFTTATLVFPTPSHSVAPLSGTYYAFLSDGEVITITRQATPYATTLDDGRVTTISARATTANVVVSTTSAGQTIYRTLQTTVYVNPTATDAQNDPSAGADLSKGGIAGAVVGAILAILLLVGLGVFLVRRRRRMALRRHPEGKEREDVRSQVIARHEKDGLGVSELHQDAVMFEARDGARYELEQPRPELEGSRP